MNQQQQLPGENTYYLCMESEHELKIAKAWLKAQHPKGTAAKLVQELRISRLNEKHTVIALYREDGCTPALLSPIDPATGGRRVEAAVIDGTLLAEVVQGRPIRVRDHWQTTSGEDELQDGDINRSTFLQELGKTLRSPAIIKRSTDQQFVRIGT